MPLAQNVKGIRSLSIKRQLCFQNYDICEYVKFGAIAWKLYILLKFESKHPDAHVWHASLCLYAANHILFLRSRFWANYFSILRGFLP